MFQNYRFDFDNKNDFQTKFDFNLDFRATGQRVFLSVEYIGNEGCFYYQNKFKSPDSCSEDVCDVPTDLGLIPLWGNQATLNWTSVPNGTTYQYHYRKNEYPRMVWSMDGSNRGDNL